MLVFLKMLEVWLLFTIKGYRQRDLVPSFSIHIQRTCDDELKG